MLLKRVKINQLSKVAFSKGETAPSEYKGVLTWAFGVSPKYFSRSSISSVLLTGELNTGSLILPHIGELVGQQESRLLQRVVNSEEHHSLMEIAAGTKRD